MISDDRKSWYLINASPDFPAQIQAFPDLRPDGARRVPIAAVMLTDAELDHTFGLLLMREGRGVQVHATDSVYQTLINGSGILTTLDAYCPVTWHEVTPGAETSLTQGLRYRAFDVPTNKSARFDGTVPYGRVVGYRFTGADSKHAVIYLPGLARMDAGILDELSDCAVLLVDGTCWQDDEMSRLGLATKTSRQMGHLPITGPGGTLDELTRLPIDRVIYTHINNTNPILLEDSAQRRVLEDKGIEVATDGLELEV